MEFRCDEIDELCYVQASVVPTYALGDKETLGCDESMVRELSRYDTVGLARRPKFRRSGVSTATNGEPHEPKGCWSPGLPLISGDLFSFIY